MKRRAYILSATKSAWLLVAAILTIGLAACSSDDKIIDEQSVQPVMPMEKIPVTVSAGFGDDGTRSAVDYTNGTRRLQFTEGDRLYVRANIGNRQQDGDGTEYYAYIMAGYLTIDPTTIVNGTQAAFSGDLTVYAAKRDGADYSYPEENAVADVTGIITTPAAPFNNCSDIQGMLVHKDAGDLFETDSKKNGKYKHEWAANANALMTSALCVKGDYHAGSFTLAADNQAPILNCTIKGLEANATYNVYYLYGDNSQAFNTPVATDGTGTATFACFGKGDISLRHAIRLINTTKSSYWMLADIGQKTLAGKVYNVTRNVVADPDRPKPANAPTISRNDGLNQTEMILGDPGEYKIYGTYNKNTKKYAQDIDITISGNSNGYYFKLNGGGVVRLAGNGRADLGRDPFISSSVNYDLTVILESDYTICCNLQNAILSGGDLRFGVSSGEHKLTLIVEEEDDVEPEYYDYYGYGGVYPPCDEYSHVPDAIAGCTISLKYAYGSITSYTTYEYLIKKTN